MRPFLTKYTTYQPTVFEFQSLLSSSFWKLEILKRACIVLETPVVCLNHSCDDIADVDWELCSVSHCS